MVHFINRVKLVAPNLAYGKARGSSALAPSISMTFSKVLARRSRFSLARHPLTQGAMRTSTELINHWKLVRLCNSISFARAISKVLVPAVTTAVCPAGTGPELNKWAK